jgi:hypothetical protein
MMWMMDNKREEEKDQRKKGDQHTINPFQGKVDRAFWMTEGGEGEEK